MWQVDIAGVARGGKRCCKTRFNQRVCTHLPHKFNFAWKSWQEDQRGNVSWHSVTREFLCPLNAFTLKSLLVGKHLPVPRGIWRTRGRSRALQTSIYPCWPCMRGLRQYFHIIPRSVFPWRTHYKPDYSTSLKPPTLSASEQVNKHVYSSKLFSNTPRLLGQNGGLCLCSVLSIYCRWISCNNSTKLILLLPLN